MKFGLLAVSLLAASGCATVIRGTKDNPKFQSMPEGATVTVESISADRLGPFTCTTPCELELKRKRDWSVLFELDGYKPVTGTLEPKVTGGGVASGAGNVLAGGIIGIGVDAGTGANLDLRPNPLVAELSQVDSDQPSRIVTIDKDDDAVADSELEAPDAVADDALDPVATDPVDDSVDAAAETTSD